MKLEAECNNVHIGTLSVTDGIGAVPRIKFYGISNDWVTPTGKTVTFEREDWGRQLHASNAVVAFFEELVRNHPDFAHPLMEKHGITYCEDDDTP